MSEPRLKMGRVGEMSPPPGLVRDLESFDPDLRLVWNVPDQCWMVVQKVRRNVYVGDWQGSRITEVQEVDKPVLFLSDLQHEPDRRIFAQLSRQRAFDQQERRARMERKVREDAEAKKKERQDRFEPAREGMEEGYYAMRRKGLTDSVAPSYVPRSLPAA